MNKYLVEIILTTAEVKKLELALLYFNDVRIHEKLPIWKMQQYIEYIANKGILKEIGL